MNFVIFVNKNYLASSPFLDAFWLSDVLGKLIFLGLFALSICSWVVIIYKGWLTYSARKQASLFYQIFESQRMNPLNLEWEQKKYRNEFNPFLHLYFVLKRHTLEVLNKNRRFGKLKNIAESDSLISYLSQADIEFVQSHLMTAVASQTKFLEKNLFFLSTIVSLAPFLGLLGTVWGILTTFSDLQMNAGGGSHQAVLGGISLALATTVLGLIDAIPALIGYNYLKNFVRDFQIDMEAFSNDLLASVEMYYRRVDAL